MYHRVAELSSDPWELAVSPNHFAEHLDVLRRIGNPLSLGRAMAMLEDRDLPGATFVVTFDDGYADNLQKAQPILERYDVPATIFVTTGFIGNDREPWWDELEGILLGSAPLPAGLRVTVGARTLAWNLDESARQPVGRDGLYRAVHHTLMSLAADERRSALDDLRARTGITAGARESHRCLSPAELIALARDELIEIGAHTVNHPMLTALPEDSQRWEIGQSKRELESLLGRPVTSFAYPYGHHTEDVVALVRKAGYSSASSIHPGPVNRQSDRFRLPRLKVRDWEGDGLARILSEISRLR